MVCLMQTVTLGEIGMTLTFIVGLLTAIGYLKEKGKNLINSSIKADLKSIGDKIDKLDKKVDSVDMNSTKNFLVARLSEIESGQKMDEIERERFWEQYEHYQKIGGNSYVHEKVEKLKESGFL